MSKYEVISDNFAGHEKGDTVTAKQLHGVNIDGLLGVHLKDTNPTTKKEK